MTSTRYLLERIAKVFGIHRKTQRLSDAAVEMHLLREAEAHLGEAIWTKVEPIAELSHVYWTLRKLAKNKDDLHKRLAVCEQRLNQASAERDRLQEEQTHNQNQHEWAQRKQLLETLEGFARQRDEIIREGRTVRRQYNGTMTKLEVISATNECDSQQLNAIHSELESLREHFEQLRVARDHLTNQIRQGDALLDQINAKLKHVSLKNEEALAAAFLNISQANKEVWQLRAECGLIDTRMHQLFIEVGHHISRNTTVDRQCKIAAAHHHGLVDVMRALRRSIALNHKLAGTI